MFETSCRSQRDSLRVEMFGPSLLYFVMYAAFNPRFQNRKSMGASSMRAFVCCKPDKSNKSGENTMHFRTARETWTPSDLHLAQQKWLAVLPDGGQLRLERRRPGLLSRLKKRLAKPTP
jgi:hypothetical protein